MSRSKQRPLPMEAIQQKFDYCGETGIITLRSNGEQTGWDHPSGYTYLSVREGCKTRNLLYHRVAYALYFGEDPTPWEIDHINRDRRDNRITNLRLANAHQQGRNRDKCKRRRVEVIIDGLCYEFDDIGDASVELGINRSTILSRINNPFTARYL